MSVAGNPELDWASGERVRITFGRFLSLVRLGKVSRSERIDDANVRPFVAVTCEKFLMLWVATKASRASREASCFAHCGVVRLVVEVRTHAMRWETPPGDRILLRYTG